MKGTLILADPAPYSGHHPMHQALFLKAFFEYDVPILTLTNDPAKLVADMDSTLAGSSKRFIAEHLPIADFPQKGNFYWVRYKEAVASAKVLRTAVERATAEHGILEFGIFSNLLDAYLSPFVSPAKMDRLLPMPWSGLHMHPHRARSSGLKARIGERFFAPDRTISAKHCRAVCVNDTGVIARLQGRHPDTPILALPDTSPTALIKADPLFLQRFRDFKKGRKVVILPGELSKRKGLFTFLRTVDDSKDDGICFVAAGKLYTRELSEETASRIKAAADRNAGKLFFYPERIPEEDTLNALIAESDIVWAAYEDFTHTSNLLTKASFFEKPAIVSDGYCMAEQARAFRLGTVISQGSVADAVHAVSDLAHQGSKGPYGFAEFYMDQSEPRFIEQCGKVLRYLGLR